MCDLNDNSLSRLPADLFSNLTNLQTIDLGRNHLGNVTENVPIALFSELSKLKYIKMDNNCLRNLLGSLFS